ncbi:hypothetical protein CBL_12833 [Carabus blaptoides fortunei]
MPRIHKHTPGTTHRRNYSLNNIELALQAVVDGGMSFGQAATTSGVPKTTIYRKYRGQNTDILGRPPILRREEEKKIVESLLLVATYGYPFAMKDLKEFVQQYLNRKGVVIPCFHNNLPGVEWTTHFLERNREISRRNSENMKRARANLSLETITEYFENLKSVLDGVPPENIINFDETNITDDPGKVKVLVKRGSKHARKILDSSKQSTSVMFAASGDGSLLPLYIVYKAKNLYPEWVLRGPEGAHYNRSASGWFDSDIFEDWFAKIALPFLKRKDGKKVVIGDNCASHMSYNIIKQCEQNDIAFVFLPPNSTHLCQPLDALYFARLNQHGEKF